MNKGKSLKKAGEAEESISVEETREKAKEARLLRIEARHSRRFPVLPSF